MTQLDRTRIPITDPETEATHYGIPVAHVGEDGDMLALGHPGTRRAFAAFNRHARVFCHLANLADDQNASLSDWADVIEEKWAIFRKADPDNCWEDPDCSWFYDEADESTPGALPVTILTVT
ncbi:hypothetical protein [Streptomyces sp. NPDC060001]|uniref:hypothetical protein n=1 Tax=Streptomyces sp. NPDC060001 TaxID=3347032 RepID=UPI003683A503